MSTLQKPEETKPPTTTEKPKSAAKEWWDSIWFAVVAATLIRWLIFDPYTIPTPSMESSLMVGDFLFVSRLHYGTRTPKTPLQIPLTHQTIWGTKIPSYSSVLDLPIFRTPGFSSVKNNEVVVFNWPGDYGVHPTDLRTNYIKRCIGIAGDVLEIKNQQVFVNGKAVENPPQSQSDYFIKTSQTLDEAFFRKYDVVNDEENQSFNWQPVMEYDTIKKTPVTLGYRVNASASVIAELKKQQWCQKVEPYIYPASPDVYPQSKELGWSADNFGPLQLPKEGQTISLTPDNIAKYGQVIEKYEGNKQVVVSTNSVSIEGKEIKEYTFKQDYYFMMGDNRHNSLDSRFWGFVPKDHIVGKAVFVWLSVDKNPEHWYNFLRWGRMFRPIN